MHQRAKNRPKPASPLTAEEQAERERLRAEKKAQDEADARAGAEHLGDLSLLTKGQHYSMALAKWTRAGWPTRLPKDAAACEAICRSNQCHLFDDEQVACKKCGCYISAARWAIFSKTKMATEKCPKGLW
jgi:hypothetical protein